MANTKTEQVFSVTVTEMVRVIRACRLRASFPLSCTPQALKRAGIVCSGTFHNAGVF
jgi:hypothetical protein